MRKTFKYRLQGNSKTFEKAEIWIDLCRKLYNIALEQRISIYRQNHGRTYSYAQMRQLPELKVAFPEYKEVNGQVLQEVLQRLERAYQNFFRRVKNGEEKVGFPRFKGKNRYNGFTLKQWGWKLDGKYLTITNIGRFKLRLSRPIEGNIKIVTIHRTPTNKWYVLFSCDNVPERKLSESDKEIGIDVGISSFCADSDGNKKYNPMYLRQSEALLRRRLRRMCRRHRGSNRRKKARLLVAKTHEKIVNQRNEFLHDTANYYVKNYETIYIEDLAICNMIRNPRLSKSISDSSWGRFFELLFYKVEGTDKKVVKIPRFEPTSKTCSVCGYVNQELKLSDRIWICPRCGTKHDRDINSAKNILQVGQTCRSLTCEVAQCVDRESLELGNVKCPEP